MGPKTGPRAPNPSENRDFAISAYLRNLDFRWRFAQENPSGFKLGKLALPAHGGHFFDFIVKKGSIWNRPFLAISAFYAEFSATFCVFRVKMTPFWAKSLKIGQKLAIFAKSSKIGQKMPGICWNFAKKWQKSPKRAPKSGFLGPNP